MEVGAVKQAFNNEIILLKKNLNQARIQIIHKLTRKAKTFVEKKGTEKLKEKFKKKAESAVKEVMIIKKIKAKDIAKFIVTHEGELKSYLNKPEVNQDKACARLLLHKSLQEKYKYIKDRFGNSSIEDLFMSRLERRKMKTEAREKQKNKKKGKQVLKNVNYEGDWEVQEVNNTCVENNVSNSNDEDMNEISASDSEHSEEVGKSEDDISNNSEIDEEKNNDDLKRKEIEDDDNSNDKDEEKTINTNLKSSKKSSLNEVNGIITNKKRKDANKNKNFNEKILKRKFNKVVEDEPIQEIKIADPFFVTQTGESYMSVVEPRQPDELKEIHKEGNRKYRRAVMFGHVPKPKRKPKWDEFQQENRRFKDLSNTSSKFIDSKNSQNNRFRPEVSEKPEIEKVEKLHPSWEAKKRKSGILPFEGKKIVFDEE